MLQEYEDDYFFEEDKILYTDGVNHKNNKIILSSKQSIKQNETSTTTTTTTTSPTTVATVDQSPKPPINNNNNNTNRRSFEIEEINLNMEYFPELSLFAADRIGSDPATLLLAYQRQEMDRLGMTVTSGSVIIKKDQTNLIGISIGGGSPCCPCLYIVQIFDGTPAAKDGTLQSGDELLGVNGTSVKGKTKVDVAKMIQAATDEVVIHYNKLHADLIQGETFDIALKKMKHRFVEGLSSSAADSLGLSRAILCNDSLVKRLKELQDTEIMYRGLVDSTKRMLKAYFDLLQGYQAFGNCFAAISVREPQARASEAFRIFGEIHRNLERDGVKMLKTIKPVLSDMGTYLTKAIPDTKLTIRRYADAKFTYLSYCLKVKEMDDEEHSYASIQEPLYRVETGNYEYRLILRCRQSARCKFAGLRSDVLEKMELLESKHARDLASQLKRFLVGLSNFSCEAVERFQEHAHLFPVEVDLKSSAFQYESTRQLQQQQESDCGHENSTNVEDEIGEEASECNDNKINIISNNNNKSSNDQNISDGLLSEFQNINLNAIGNDENDLLLQELGLSGIDLSVGGGGGGSCGPTNGSNSISQSGNINITSEFDLLN